MKAYCRSKTAVLTLLSVGLLVLIAGLFFLRANDGAAFWSSVSGEIFGSRTVVRSDPSGDAYIPVVLYRYDVGEQTFQGDQITFTPNYAGMSKTAAEEILRPYPIEESVLVFYNPDKPEMSVLERGSFLASWIAIGLGLLLVLAGSILLARRKPNR